PLMTAAAAGNVKPGEVFFSGFQIADGGRVTAALSAPVFYLDACFGAVVFMLDMAPFEALLNDSTGIGATEQTLLATSEGVAARPGEEEGGGRTYKMPDVETSKGIWRLDGTLVRFQAAEGTYMGRPFIVVEAVDQTELAAAASK